MFIPGIGFLLVKLFPLTPDASVGILLLAAISGPSNCLAIHPHGQDALGVRRGDDLRVIAGEHRLNAIGCRGNAANGATQRATDPELNRRRFAVHCTAVVRRIVGGSACSKNRASTRTAARNSCNRRVSFPDVGDAPGAPRGPACDRRARDHPSDVLVAGYIDADRQHATRLAVGGRLRIGMRSVIVVL